MIVGSIIGGVLALLVIIFVVSGIRYIPASKVGLVTRTILGDKMPEGHIMATRGQMGVQAETLMPGLYWKMPIVFGVSKVSVTIIPEDSIGVIEAIDGEPLQHGRLLGDPVDCNSFQDALGFLTKHGKKGPQIEILRPGIYRINPRLFIVTVEPRIHIEEDQIGIVASSDGTPLPAGYVISPAPTADHKYYQDGKAFIENGGYRGVQLETLQPGTYYINPLLFNVSIIDKCVVPPGYVAVIVSNTGLELEHGVFKTEPDLGKSTHDESEKLLITDKLQRGILVDPVAPGAYNLNTLAYRPILVPISAITVDWAAEEQFRMAGSANEDLSFQVSGQVGKSVLKETVADTSKSGEFFKFSQLEVITKDGFHLQVDVRIVIRVEPKDASFVIARFGSVQNLIQQIVHPLIDASFRNEAGNKDALNFISDRVELQQGAHDKAVEVFAKHHVMVQNLLVGYISAPEELLKTQSLKQIATQQKTQFAEQAEAAKALIEVREKEARANKQTDVVNAELSIVIQKNNAEALVATADGDRRAAIARAAGTASQILQTGEAQAKAYTMQAEAIGKDAIAGITIAKEIGDKNIKVVPDIYVGSQGIEGLFGGFLAQYLNKGLLVKPPYPPEIPSIQSKEV